MERYGIDLGTRNTAVECPSGALTMAHGATIPSAVAYDQLSNDVKFGEEAIQLLREQNSEVRARWHVATSFKTALASDAPFVRTPRGSKTAREVLEDYFRWLVTQAERKGLPKLSRAVFAIPVGFDPLSRQRMLGAARAAGIEPIGIVTESTAAFITVAQHLGLVERVAVVDWGAGTLDVSVLKIFGSAAVGMHVEEHACKGSRVAGDQIDISVYEFFVASARREGKTVPQRDEIPKELMRSVLRVCELEKISLSEKETDQEETDVTFVKFVDGSPATFRFSAAHLRGISAPACAEVLHVVTAALADAGLTADQLDRVIFVGGCTGIIGFREAAEKQFGRAVIYPDAPEWAVARGAIEVARGGTAYECQQEFGCVLDDGRFLTLTKSPAKFDGTSMTVTVACTEQAINASLIFADRQTDKVTMAGSLSVPLQGHLGEPIHIRTTLNHDLTVRIEAWSRCCNADEDVRRLDLTDTRFRFKLDA